MYMNKNLPILPMEIVNKILIMRESHTIAKLFEEDENVKIWKKILQNKMVLLCILF